MGFFGWKEKRSIGVKKETPTAGKSELPPPGTLPAEGRKILESTYESCRTENPDWTKKKCSMIAWGAVKKKWQKDKQSGKWSKKE